MNNSITDTVSDCHPLILLIISQYHTSLWRTKASRNDSADAQIWKNKHCCLRRNIKLPHVFEGPLRLSVVPQVLFLPLHLPSADLRWQAEETVLTFLLLIHADKACRHNSSWTRTRTQEKEQPNPYTHLCLQIGVPAHCSCCLWSEFALEWLRWTGVFCDCPAKDGESERVNKKWDKSHHCIILPALTGFHELINVLRN